MSPSVRPKTFAIAALAAVPLTVSLCVRRSAHDDGKPADPSLIDGRVWVELRPEKLTDYVQAALFMSRANFGFFERASAYDVHFEFFDMTRDSRTVKVTFPQTDKSATFGFAVNTCDDLKPFDLCLELTKNPWGGPKRYRGFSKPEDEEATLGLLARALCQAARR